MQCSTILITIIGVNVVSQSENSSPRSTNTWELEPESERKHFIYREYYFIEFFILITINIP